MWRKAYRIVSSRYPPIGVFEGVTDPADLEIIYDIESLTNPRLRDEMGQISLVHPDDSHHGRIHPSESVG